MVEGLVQIEMNVLPIMEAVSIAAPILRVPSHAVVSLATPPMEGFAWILMNAQLQMVDVNSLAQILMDPSPVPVEMVTVLPTTGEFVMVSWTIDPPPLY